MARVAFVSCVCVVVAVLSGCSLVPDYRRPDTPAPTQWSTRSPTDLAAAVPVTSGWWHVYRDSTLDALISRALAHSDTLASAIATVDAARANAEKAGALRYPIVTLDGSVARGHAPASDSSSLRQSVFAQASYEADFWGGNAASAHAADALTRASEFDRDVVALTLTASVADTYFQVLSLRRRVALANAISADAQQLLQLVMAQRAAGVATELQVQQQRNALAAFQAQVPILEQQRDQSVHLLAMLVGTVPAEFAVPDGSLETMAIPDVRRDLPATILEMRPDIRAEEMRLEAANENIGVARAAFLPNVTLTAQGGTGSRALAQFLQNPLGSLAASIVAPVFDGGALAGQLKLSHAEFERNAADYRQTVVAAFQDVEDALTVADDQRRAERSDIEAAEAANHAASLARAEYEAGTVDFLTVLDAQRTRYQADDAREQTRLARLQASVGIFRAFGGGVVTELVFDGRPDKAKENAGLAFG